MKRVAILTDSTANLPDHLLRELNISVVPLTLVWDGQSLKDGVDIQPGEFYQRLAAAKSMPSTSQVTTQEMDQAFRKLLDQDFEVLAILLSSRFSGTVESAQRACAENPAFQEHVQVVDSLFTTMAMGWAVLAAARAAIQGAGLADVHQAALAACRNCGVLFVVDTLEYLRRGGRIGGAQALLGTALNIKPVLEMRDGRIESLERVRTKKHALARMLELVASRTSGREPIRLAAVHANAQEEAQALLEEAGRVLPLQGTLCCPLSPVIGTHAGPGTVALAYMAGTGW